jgi:hypothetical protein
LRKKALKIQAAKEVFNPPIPDRSVDLKSLLLVDDMGGMEEEVFVSEAKNESWFNLIYDF